MDLVTIRTQLAAICDPKLVAELLEAYQEAKRNFALGGLRLNAVEGGRFCEAVYRLLEERTTGTFTPIGRQLDTEKISRDLAGIPQSQQPESIRLHLPRSLRVVYDIRNKRDTAHLGDGIDPNFQDATLVCSILDWILAELIRLFHKVSANEAQRLVEDIVARKAPAVQEFGEFLKVLNPNLSASDHVLLLLYQRGSAGADYQELFDWCRKVMRANLRRTLNRLVDAKAFVHSEGEHYTVTLSGIHEVETRRLFDFPGKAQQSK